MGEASSYDGYVHHLAVAGVTYINVPNGPTDASAGAAAAGGGLAPQPWTAADASTDPVHGLSFGELDVPRALFDGTVDSFAAGPAAMGGLQTGAQMHSSGTLNRHGFPGGSANTQAGWGPLQAAQQPGERLQQRHQYQLAHQQPRSVGPRPPDGSQPNGAGWPPLAADGYPALVFSAPPTRQHASTRSTSAPQLAAQQAYEQHHTLLGEAPLQAQAPQLSSASGLRAGFLQAPPEVQHRLMQEASLLRQQSWRQQQQQQQLVGRLVGDSPQSSPSGGGFDPRLAHATARLSDFDLSSRANSTNSRFSAAETMTSSGSLPASQAGGLVPPQPLGTSAPGLAATLGFSNPVGVYDPLSPGQPGDFADRSAGPQGPGGLAPAGLAEPFQQEQLPGGHWQTQQQLTASQQQFTWQQQQQHQPPLPPALGDDAMRDWAGITAGMDWEMGERQSPVVLPDAPQPWQGGGLAVLNPDALTRGSSMPSPVTQLAPVVEDVPAMVSSMCTTSLSLPLHQTSAPAISAPLVAEEIQQPQHQQGLDRARSLSPQRTPTKRRSQQRPGRPPKPSAAAALAAAQACGEPPPLLRHPARTSQQRGPSPLSIPPEHAGSSHDSSRPPAGTSDGTNQGSFSGSLVETVAQLGELHAKLEAGHARVQAAVAAIQRGWNNEVDFRVSPELAAELAGLGEAERKAHERKERNKQSASAARAKRSEYDSALEALLQAMVREAAFYRTVLREAAPADQPQRRGPAPSPHGSPDDAVGLSAAGSSSGSSSRSSGSRGTNKRTARARGRKAAATP